jgi:hypothetical protein
VALCGHWDHEPPCPLAPHRVSADEVGGELRVRILFAAEPDTEPEVRRLIELALSGQAEFPEGFTTPWRLRASRPSKVSAEDSPSRAPDSQLTRRPAIARPPPERPQLGD